jgi:cytochrome c peroxidase
MKMRWTFAGALIVLVLACEPFENGNQELVLDLPEQPFSYGVVGVTDDTPTLGRVLFYDTRLSLNNSVSCASCHKQALAFSDNAALSRGFENRVTPRNSMAIQNIISDAFREFVLPSDSSGNSDSTIFIDPIDPSVIGYMPGVPVSPEFVSTPTSLFWDGRESNLKLMVTRPIMNHIEMGIHNMDELAEKLNQIPEYKPLFEKAFGAQTVTSERISQGLSAFLLSIRSSQSKFDRAMVFRTDATTFDIKPSTSLTVTPTINLTAQEELGHQLFFNKFNCNNCHDANGFADIGLDATPKDDGLMETTFVLEHKGQFKIPSLRNVELTGPYMHDGRFKTLEEVLEHYSHGIKNSANLDARLKDINGRPLQMNMTQSEVKAIKAFLTTLTDYQMISDVRFSNPFRVK